MSKSPTITNPDWLDNPDAGDMLASEFMEPLGLTATDLAEALMLPVARVERMIDGRQPVDADLDLRLGRYFGMSEGYFLRLQNAYDLLEAKRTTGPAIEQVLPRAA